MAVQRALRPSATSPEEDFAGPCICILFMCILVVLARKLLTNKLHGSIPPGLVPTPGGMFISSTVLVWIMSRACRDNDRQWMRLTQPPHKNCVPTSATSWRQLQHTGRVHSSDYSPHGLIWNYVVPRPFSLRGTSSYNMASLQGRDNFRHLCMGHTMERSRKCIARQPRTTSRHAATSNIWPIHAASTTTNPWSVPGGTTWSMPHALVYTERRPRVQTPSISYVFLIDFLTSCFAPLAQRRRQNSHMFTPTPAYRTTTTNWRPQPVAGNPSICAGGGRCSLGPLSRPAQSWQRRKRFLALSPTT